MPAPKVLFTAPRDFDKVVEAEYEAAFSMDWDTRRPLQYAAWVCDPSANFVISDSHLAFFPSLRALATPSTGKNHIDLMACARRNVKVISLLNDREGMENISASSEFTFKLLLDALRLPPARELQGKVVGLVGYGRIGHRVAKWCQHFGAPSCFHDPAVPGGRPLRSIFKTCDAVVICCALTGETEGMIGADLLRLLPQGAALVNTARGEIIREDELLQVMDERRDLRVAVDVVTGMVNGTAKPEELRRRGAIVTPHIAGATYDSRTKAAKIILNLLRKELL